MSDLVKRLENRADYWHRTGRGNEEHTGFFSRDDAILCREAARDLRAAAERIERLEAALKTIEAMRPEKKPPTLEMGIWDRIDSLNFETGENRAAIERSELLWEIADIAQNALTGGQHA